MSRKVLNGLDLVNQKIVNLGSPSAATDAANKSYVDGLINGQQWKQAVRAASTTNGTLASAFANGQILDGVTLATNDRILIKNQSTGSENGIYVVNASGAPTRAVDADGAGEIGPNATVYVSEGTVNADTAWTVTNNGTITIGSTSLTFAQTGGGGGTTYTAGDGLNLVSDEFSIDLDTNSGLSVSGSGLKIDVGVVVRKFAQDIGNGSLTTINVTHSLGTTDVDVDVFTNDSTKETVDCDIERPDANTVRLKFATAPASGAYRVVVQG